MTFGNFIPLRVKVEICNLNFKSHINCIDIYDIPFTLLIIWCSCGELIEFYILLKLHHSIWALFTL